jgi:ubiquitin-conjugating enzyme E2 W
MAQRMSKRLQKEYEAIMKNSQEMKVILPNNDLSLWHVQFLGAKGTLYEGESFSLQLRFTNEYVLADPLSLSNLPRLSS